MGNSSDNQKPIEEPKKKKIHYTQYKPEKFKEFMAKLSVIDQINKNRAFYQELDRSQLDNFSIKYNKYIGIDRFCIPIIGAISCGKSTFMNYLLPFHNILEVGEKITTKFICIIRHCKDTNIPEIYKVKIEERGEKEFNFKETGDNLLDISSTDLSLNLADIIRGKNMEVKKKEDSEEYKMNPENYFLIIKMKIPIFEGYENYGELIDFIDIPGLDEVKQINNFDDYIKPIFKNILFPIFIFDLKTYTREMPKEILIQYLNYYYKVLDEEFLNTDNIFDKGFFILNKIDKKEKDSLEDIIEDFQKNYKELKIRKGKIKIPFKNDGNNNRFNDFIPISAKNLLLEQGSFMNKIIEDIIQKANDTKFNSFKKFIKDNFSKDNFDISKVEDIKEEEKTEEVEKELILINKHLKEECQNLNNPKFTIKEYINIKKRYSNNPQKKDELKEMLLKRIKNLIDTFLNFEFDELATIKMNENLINEIKIDQNYDPLEFTNIFNREVIKLFPNKINIQYKKINEIKENYEEFEKYKNNNKIRILFIGKISTGKTSLLNSIIGNNKYILETTNKECTQAIYIIKNAKKISFGESQIVENQFEKYFKDTKDIKKYEEEQIKDEIHILNTNQRDNDIIKYYSIYIPIEGLENDEKNNEFNQINKDNIELIDIPGFKDSKLKKQKYLKDLIDMCDGFVFSFDAVNIEDKESQEIFSTIMGYIKAKTDTFNFNNCLFNLNYFDKVKKNEIEDKIKDFKKNLQEILIKNIYVGDLIEKVKLKKKIKDLENINISYISNKTYEKYQEEISSIQKLEILDEEDNLDTIFLF